jgi:hypothetical protein
MSQLVAATQSVDDEVLLEIWERALTQAPSLRGDTALELAGGETAPPPTLGERNKRLVALHGRLFGDAIDLLSHCGRCGTAVQFGTTCRALSTPAAAATPAHGRVDVEGYAIDFRLPEPMDVAEASSAAGDGEFVDRLLARCIQRSTRNGERVSIADVPEAVLDAVSQEMEALDPAARVSFAVACPQCGSAWDAALDLGQLLWAKLQAAAERLLFDIDTLARAYGWTERDVLALSPVRRAAYVQLVTG